MKKKLEAELMSIAHRVLQMKNKSDINQLCIETQKLHEKLSVLRFIEEHFEGAKPTIGQAEVVAKMKQFFEENNLTEVKPATSNLKMVSDNVVEQEVTEQEIIEEEVLNKETEEAVIETENIHPDVVAELNELVSTEDVDTINDEPEKLEDVGFLPAFELDVQADAVIETPKKAESFQISFDELLGIDYSQANFVRVDARMSNPLDFELPKDTPVQNIIQEEPLAELLINPIDINPINVATFDRLSSGINIGLNDRIAFVKHLFSNSDEDYNRVMNQLITFDSLEEAKNFIEDMVKPDYNDWIGKEDYEQRFVEIIEKKFG
jgi:hypothetical protein